MTRMMRAAGVAAWAWVAGSGVLAQEAAPRAPEGVAAHCRIVDYGADYTWMGTALRGGVGLMRQDHTVDVDGDGATNDDVVIYNEFSLTNPISPRAPEWDTTAPNAVIYGGMAAFFTHTAHPILGENMSNTDHAERDDLNLHFYADKSPAEKARGYGIWLWKKEDFLNGGDRNPVAFDEASRMVVYISRYWLDWEECRFVVQDGEQFFISMDAYSGNGEGRGRAHILYPTKTKWAPYNPQGPYAIAFDKKAATFVEHRFTDVRAVGWYIAKDTLSKSACWMKWNAFEVNGVVTRPWRPSENLEMVKVLPGPQGSAGPAGGYMSRTEIPYDTWKSVYKWASSSQYAVEPGYVFDRDGDMGSMDAGANPHGQKEPVTDITWLDAVAWCNALSELEGKTPCYYADAEKKTPFRMVKERRYKLEKPYVPAVYVRWEADGYRLPTEGEWTEVWRKGPGRAPAAPASAPSSTHPVDASAPDAAGLHDLLGNVWEYCWDVAGDACATPPESHTVLGGDFRHPADPAAVPLSPWGDLPGVGSGSIGFRVVRYEGGGTPPAAVVVSDAAAGVPRWTFRVADAIKPAALPARPSAPVLDLVSVPAGSYLRSDEATVTLSPFQMSRCEIPYAAWQRVYQWAVMNGYAFDHDGDMGSMDHLSFPHTPDEPVTDISWFDSVVWCNALSEFEGRTPVYYADAAKTQPFRTSHSYRLPMFLLSELYDAIRGAPAPLNRAPSVFAKWEADGYRLPTRSEWEYARLAGVKDPKPWDAKILDEQLWYGRNSGQTTHAVGTKQANPLGLHDLTGNVFEWSWSRNGAVSYYDNRNPKGECGGEGGGAGGGAHATGGSFQFIETTVHGNSIFGTWRPPGLISYGSYPEIGFRVVRCEAGTHPAAGESQEEQTVLTIDPARFDAQQNACYRANLMRTGVFTTTGVPALKGLKWKVQTGGKVISSPVVAGGTLYVGSNDRKLYAIDAASGAVRWTFATGGEVQGSAAVAGGVVYILSGDSSLYALDAGTGEKRWVQSLTRGSALASTPAVAHDVIFTAMGPSYAACMYGLAVATGAPLWRFRDGGTPGGLAAAALTPDMAYFSYAAAIDAASLRTERRRWNFNTASDHGQTTPAVADGVVYGTGSSGVAALDAVTGARRWLYKKDTWPRDPTFSSPSVWEGMVYVGNDDGSLYALDAATGKPVWAFATGAAVYSSPAVAGGVVYFGSWDKTFYAVEAKTGVAKWTFETGGPIQSSPAVGDGAVYVGSEDGWVYAFN